VRYVFSKDGVFHGRKDPNAHIKNFRAQMLICGGSEVVQCKMLGSTLVGVTLD